MNGWIDTKTHVDAYSVQKRLNFDINRSFSAKLITFEIRKVRYSAKMIVLAGEKVATIYGIAVVFRVK